MERNLNNIIDDLGIREQVEAMPFYNGANKVDFEKIGFPKMPEGEITIDPSDPRLAQNFIKVTKSTLPEVKELVGIPESVINSNKRTFAEMIDEEDTGSGTLIQKASRCLTEPLARFNSRSFTDIKEKKEIEEFIVKTAADLPVFLAEELTVEDGKSIEVKDTIVLVFRRLILKGSGKLDLSGNYFVKVVSKELKG